jgi:hypothetical protein
MAPILSRTTVAHDDDFWVRNACGFVRKKGVLAELEI